MSAPPSDLPSPTQYLLVSSTEFDGLRRTIERLAERVEQLCAKPQARPDDKSGKKYLSVRETAHQLGVAEKTVRRLLNRGLLKGSKGTRHIRIPVGEIEEFGKRTI